MHQKMSFGELPQEEASRRNDAALESTERISNAPSSEAANGAKELHSTGQRIKECPVCHARCFADMDVCYNCLHSFRQEEQQGFDAAAPRGRKEFAAPIDSRRLVDKNEIAGEGLSGSLRPDLSPEGFEEGGLGEPSPAADSCSGAESDEVGKVPLESGKVLEIVVSISLSQDACLRHGVTPVVKVETR